MKITILILTALAVLVGVPAITAPSGEGDNSNIDATPEMLANGWQGIDAAGVHIFVDPSGKNRDPNSVPWMAGLGPDWDFQHQEHPEFGEFAHLTSLEDYKRHARSVRDAEDLSWVIASAKVALEKDEADRFIAFTKSLTIASK